MSAGPRDVDTFARAEEAASFVGDIFQSATAYSTVASEGLIDGLPEAPDARCEVVDTAAGGDRFLVKPCEPEQILEIVERANEC
jgi:hypothetical protein